MTELCPLCLSSNRRLRVWRPGPGDVAWVSCLLQDTISPEASICWECEANFVRVAVFRRRVLRAQEMYSGFAALKNIKSLSTLKCEETQNNFNFIYEDAIKEEKLERSDLEQNFDINTIEAVLDTPFEFDDFPIDDLDDQKPNIKTEPLSVPRRTKRTLKRLMKSKPSTSKTVKERKGKRKKYHDDRFYVKTMSEEELQDARKKETEMRRFLSTSYKCYSCIRGYYSKQMYDKHVDEKHSESVGTHKCKVCQQRFRKSAMCKSHMSEHYRSYECRLCQFVDHRINTMERHYEKEHDRGKTFPCKGCGTEFLNKRVLRHHYETTHKELPKCELCGLKFKAKNSLKRHMQYTHAGVEQYQCPICHKQYKGAEGLRSHARKHEPATGAYCAECDKRFKDVYSYHNHLKYTKQHRSEAITKFVCDHCGHRCIDKSVLSRHIMAVHLKMFQFHCHLCAKGFIRRDRLSEHVSRVHEGVPRVKDKLCGYCGKAFSVQQALMTHLRIHTGEKPFKCELCAMAFTQKSTLITHQRGRHSKLKLGNDLLYL